MKAIKFNFLFISRIVSFRKLLEENVILEEYLPGP